MSLFYTRCKTVSLVFQAYQASSQSFDSDYGSSSVRASPYSRQSSMDSVHYPPSSRDREARDRKVLSTSSLDTHAFEVPESFTHFEDPQRRQLRTSTSYTSGLSVFRDPTQHSGQDDETMKKSVFLDRRREFESRAAQENVNPNSSKAYSFGLYFPKKETKVNSAENLSRSVVIRRSRESVLQSTDSQENISKLHSGARVRNVPIEYRHSGSPDQKVQERFKSQEVLTRDIDGRSQNLHGQSSSIRHSFPDSGTQIWSPPARKSSETSSPYSFDRGTPSTDNIPSKRESYSGARQYVPVINETSISRNQKMSGSVDSIDPRSNVFHTEHHLRTAYNTGTPTNEQQNQNQPSSSRTFIVKINDKHERSNTPTASQSPIGQSGNHSYGAAFALTRSPATAEIEIRQKREPRILVSHRKKQFESRDEVSPPPTATLSGSGPPRYKTEIERYTRKFDGVQARLASFEKPGSNEPMRSRSQTPVTCQPIKVRRMSQDRVRSPEPDNSNTQYSQGNNQSNFSDSAPIRIYVSQGNSNTSGSPIVEIVPVQSSVEIEPRGQGQYVAHSNQTDSLDHADGEGQKPVRKASFLSAVNAPYSRCKYIFLLVCFYKKSCSICVVDVVSIIVCVQKLQCFNQMSIGIHMLWSYYMSHCVHCFSKSYQHSSIALRTFLNVLKLFQNIENIFLSIYKWFIY